MSTSEPILETQGRRDWRRPNRAHRVLWISAAAVMVPLILLLWLQYRWLQDLERASTVARQAALENYLGVIAKEVKYEYMTTAGRILNFPVEILEPKYSEKLAKILHKRQDPIAHRYFIVNFSLPSREVVQFLDPETQQLFVPEWTPELSAVQMAIAPWRVLRKKKGPVDDSAWIVEERDKDHRMILKPLVGEDSQLMGLIGMILDEQHLRSEVLPRVIADALPEFKNKEQLQVSVRNNRREWVLGAAEWEKFAAEHGEKTVFQNLLFVFKDWRVAVFDPGSTPKDWAQANFAFNLSLTAALGLLLFGGLGLLLRVTSRELKLSEMKNDFVSNVSHELRTPLASIRVFGELLRLGKIRDLGKVQEYGEYIETESRRLTQLINNILDFSCIESGRKAYVFEPVSLSEVLEQILDTWRIRLQHEGFEIDFRSPKALPQINADRDAVGQALFNLIDNAVKYSGDSKRIEVQVVRQDGEVVIEVEDHGIGISRSEQRHIFDRFHRVGSGLAHDVKGSGLGLALVQHIAAAHGGRVSVESHLGVGSVFALHLPLRAVETESDAEAPSLRPEIA